MALLGSLFDPILQAGQSAVNAKVSEFTTSVSNLNKPLITAEAGLSLVIVGAVLGIGFTLGSAISGEAIKPSPSWRGVTRPIMIIGGLGAVLYFLMQTSQTNKAQVTPS